MPAIMTTRRFTVDEYYRMAEAGIPEYWLVNLPDDRIEAFREPTGEGYLQVTEHHRGDVLRPVAFPDLEVPVEAVLP